MASKRERIEVIYDMMVIIRDRPDIGPTRLIHLSNLSPQMFKDYIRELIDTGLIVEESKDEKTKRKRYMITEKGFGYIAKYESFKKFIDAIGL